MVSLSEPICVTISWQVIFHRRCLHGISIRAKWNISILVYDKSLITVYIARVVSLGSIWQKWNFISSNKMLRKHFPRNEIIRKEISAHANIKETCYSNCCYRLQTAIKRALCERKMQNMHLLDFLMKIHKGH